MVVIHYCWPITGINIKIWRTQNPAVSHANCPDRGWHLGVAERDICKLAILQLDPSNYNLYKHTGFRNFHVKQKSSSCIYKQKPVASFKMQSVSVTQPAGYFLTRPMATGTWHQLARICSVSPDLNLLISLWSMLLLSDLEGERQPLFCRDSVPPSPPSVSSNAGRKS